MNPPLDARRPYVPSADTDETAHETQLAAYRRLGGEGRLAAAFRLTHFARRASAAGIRARHPAYSSDEVKRALARLLLGDELTKRVWPGAELIDP